MADYPQLAATLPALGATKTNPPDTEDISKMAAVERQLRTWMYDFLATVIDPATGKIRSEAFGTQSIAAGSIRGSTANAGGEAREVLQGTISTPDLRDYAVQADKIAEGAVTSDKILGEAVTSDKIPPLGIAEDRLADGCISEVKIQNEVVSATKLQDEAVETAKIKDRAVTSSKIAVNGVDGENLPIGSGGQVLLHNGTKFVPTSVSGSLSLSAAGVATLSLTGSSTSWARISERAASGTGGGASVATSWAQKRGVAVGWTIDEQLGTAFITVGSAGALNLIANGVFLITATIPGYAVDSHKAKAEFTPVSGSASSFISDSAEAPTATTTNCRLSFLITVSGASAGSPASLIFYHWTESVDAAGLGHAASSGEVERYATLEVLRLSA